VRFATEYNTWMPTLQQVRERRSRVVEACVAGGRDPATLRFTTLSPTIVGATRADVLERIRELLDTMIEGWDRVHDGHGDQPQPALSETDPEAFIEANQSVWVIGTVDDARKRIEELREAGSEHIYLDHRHHRDMDGIDLIGKLA